MKVSPDKIVESTLYTKKNKENPISNFTSSNIVSNPFISEITDEQGQPIKEAFQIAVNKLNEFMEHTQKNSKFIFHEGLGKYYVEVVDAKTEEVIKEIPPKELLNAYYEMQKMLGNIIDRSI